MKKRMLIFTSVIVVIGIIVGITFALIKKNVFSQNVSFNISGLDAFIIYSKGTDVLTGTLNPVSSYGDTDISTEITLYKNTTKTIYGHIYLDVSSITNDLAAESALKWVIKSNGQVLNHGSFHGSQNNDSIPLILNIPLSSSEQKFQIYIWLDDNMDINGSIAGQTLSTVVRAEASYDEYEIEPNKPALTDNLIPVKYDSANSRWVKADSSNTNNDWYDYDDKKWANAVLVSSTNRSTYVNGNVGTVIPEIDVLAYYVWIPRYKYKVFNINKTIGVDSYNAQTTGIDIKFENGNQSSGIISCNYDFTVLEGNGLSETCTGSNGDYYTHPAFTFGDDEITGFWMGKFELSSENPSLEYGGGTSIELLPKVKPNTISWRYNYFANFWKVIYDMQKSNNIYGLNTSRLYVDSHMMKSLEWGAVSYFSNSKYGRCSNSVCTVMEENNNSSYYTGGNDYVTNVNQTTTGNIFGVYDMNGGVFEIVMGVSSVNAGNYTYGSAGNFDNYTYIGYEKYIDTYAYGTTNVGQIAFNRARLGDATSETISWYNCDESHFVRNNINVFIRGVNGNYTNTSAVINNLFCFSNTSSRYDSMGARSSITVLNS